MKEEENKKNKVKTESSSPEKKPIKKGGVNSDIKKNIAAILLVIFSLLFLLSLIGQAGIAGGYINKGLGLVFGWARFLLPFLLLVLGLVYFRKYDKYRYYLTTIGVILFIFFLAIILHSFYDLTEMKEVAKSGKGGGFIGFGGAYVLIKYLGILATSILAGGFFLIGLILTFNFPLTSLLNKIRNWYVGIVSKIRTFRFTQEKKESIKKEKKTNIKESSIKFSENKGDVKDIEEVSEQIAVDYSGDKENKKKEISRVVTDWKLPPLNLLQNPRKREKPKNLDEKAELIVKTLADFGIDIYFKGYNVGPSMVQYTFEPDKGVKLSKIVTLQNNLAMALATSSIRIEAPIPGKSLIGIELPLPLKYKAEVLIKSALESANFQESKSNLTIALGQDVYGDFILEDIEQMPHLMVAGTTNAGKSVCVNTILASLLYQNSPENLKLLLIDPKRVELNFYNGIPHLVNPVIVEPSKVMKSLQWAVSKMEERYELLEEIGVRDIASYNQKARKGKKHRVEEDETGRMIYQDLEVMPYIVIVIDELNDLILNCGRDLEALIVRIVQKARAVGIHVIITTQRPSVEVITGALKANISTRIALKVATQVDSRTILDKMGAETLLGNGDMLLSSNKFDKLKRIQGAYISSQETAQLVEYIKNESIRKKIIEKDSVTTSFNEFIDESRGTQSSFISGGLGNQSEKIDELTEDAKQLAIVSGELSASVLQRRFQIGFQRASRIIDNLEKSGVIGPKNGSKPRELLIGDNDAEDE